MKLVLIISSLLFVQHLAAQTTFYFSPFVYKKLHLCGYGYEQVFGFYSENHPTRVDNPYYKFAAKRLSHRPGFDVGLNLSASFQDNKHIVSLAYATDQVGVMRKKSNLISLLPNLSSASSPVYVNSLSYFQTGFAFNRLTLGYGRLLNKKQSLNKLYLATDISYVKALFNTAAWQYINETNNWVYYHNNAQWVQTQHEALIWGGNFWLLGIGLIADLHIKLKDKPVYLFTLETKYRQGTKVMMAYQEFITINDNNQTISFLEELGSKGSGIYFQVSRKFQLYPWKL